LSFHWLKANKKNTPTGGSCPPPVGMALIEHQLRWD
jgi:hypothetical protein